MAAPAIGLRPRWAPGPHAEVDWSHPLATSMQVCILPAYQAELVRGLKVIGSAGTPGFASHRHGLAFASTTTNTYQRYGSLPAYTPGALTLAVLHAPTTLNAGNFGAALTVTTATTTACCSIQAPSNTTQLALWANGGSEITNTKYTFSAGVPILQVGVFDGTNGTHYVYSPTGFFQGSAAGTLPAITAGEVKIATERTNAQGLITNTVIAYVWYRALSAAEAGALWADPFCMLKG